jgi:hypothetical protein
MTCSRDFPPATPINNPGSAELSAALIRFVTDGLVATLEFYRAGQLPPHRFAWELTKRTDTLAELCPASRAVTRLRWLQRSINNPHTEHTELAAGGRAELSTDEQNRLTVTLASLRATSATATRTARATPPAKTSRWPHRSVDHNRTETAIGVSPTV